MKITKQQLKQIIREEIKKYLKDEHLDEAWWPFGSSKEKAPTTMGYGEEKQTGLGAQGLQAWHKPQSKYVDYSGSGGARLNVSIRKLESFLSFLEGLKDIPAIAKEIVPTKDATLGKGRMGLPDPHKVPLFPLREASLYDEWPSYNLAETIDRLIEDTNFLLAKLQNMQSQ